MPAEEERGGSAGATRDRCRRRGRAWRWTGPPPADNRDPGPRTDHRRGQRHRQGARARVTRRPRGGRLRLGQRGRVGGGSCCRRADRAASGGEGRDRLGARARRCPCLRATPHPGSRQRRRAARSSAVDLAPAWVGAVCRLRGGRRSRVRDSARDPGRAAALGRPGRADLALRAPRPGGWRHDRGPDPLRGEALEPGSSRGVSNVFASPEARIELEHGVLLAVRPERSTK